MDIDDFDPEELKTLKGGKSSHLRCWICIFMRCYHKTTRRWPRTKLIAEVFGMHPDHLKAWHLTPMVREGYLKTTPPPFNPLTRYMVKKDYPYELEPPGLIAPRDPFEEGEE